jgi:hypothetical protein
VAEYFPGSRLPVTPPSGPPDILRGREGKTYSIGGKDIELFTISQVAFFLNRKPVTIRKWEQEGTIPKATFVKPGANSDPRGRRRLYSRAQIEALIQVAHEEGILTDLHRQISKTQFKVKTWDAFKRIASGA